MPTDRKPLGGCVIYLFLGIQLAQLLCLLFLVMDAVAG
jgi:hypothetical protein